MSDKPLSRRQVLGALATTGSAGALVGTGTGALFTDEETFTDNGIRASESVAGVVDMEVTDTVPDDGNGVTYDITIPDAENNNPAYLWFRTGCPGEGELELACATSITVEVECDGETTVASGSARDVLDTLQNGTLLCGGDAACLEPGETRTLEIKITGVDEYDGDEETLTLDLEFYGEQCRYDTGAENPFDESGGCEECPEPGADRQAISYIEFCAEGASDAPEPTLTVNATNNDGETTSVNWTVENGVDVDYVVVKSGEEIPYTVYKYSSGTQSGTATVGGSEKFTGGAGKVSGYSGPGGANQNACQFAKDAVGDSGQFDGGSTKLEGGEIP